MSRLAHLGRLTGALVVLVATLAVPPSGAQSAERAAARSTAEVARVIVVTIPALGLDDIGPADTPTLVALADRGAVAALSVRTVDRRTEPAEAYATIGAGARATSPPGETGSGWAVDEELPSGGTAGEALRDRDIDPGDAEVLVPGVGRVQSANEGEHQGARIGALGAAVAGHGWETAVVANHDGPDGRIDRTAALAVVSPRGRIDAGSVSPDLVDRGPGGRRRTSPEAVVAAVVGLPDRDVVGLVEIGDVAWAEEDEDADAAADGNERRAAVRRADRTLAAVRAALGPDDLLLVLAPTAPAGREQPTPFVLVGPGVAPGLAESATTRRPGHVTLPDVAATVLDRIGAEVPTSMNATPIESRVRDSSGAARLGERADAVAEHRFVDRATGIFLVTLPIVFGAWALLVVVVLVLPAFASPRPASGPARGVVAWVGVTVLVTPTVTYLLGALEVRSWGQPAWAAVAWGSGAVLAALVLLVRRRVVAGPTAAMAAVAAFVWVVPVADLFLGGRLQFGTALGNSPTVAGRFAGIGNNAFALLTASAVLVAAAAWRGVGARGGGTRSALAAAGAVLAVSIVVDGAPGLGADVGGVLTLVPVSIVLLWLLAGRRLSWARAAVAAAATLLVLGLVTAADLARPASSRTHLGRLADRLLDGSGGSLVIRRKADAAVASFTGSSLVWVMVATLVLGALLWWLARPRLRRLLEPRWARPVVTAAGVAAVLGCVLNDSGVMVPAMMATVFVPAAVVVLLLDPDDRQPDGSGPGGIP